MKRTCTTGHLAAAVVCLGVTACSSTGPRDAPIPQQQVVFVAEQHGRFETQAKNIFLPILKAHPEVQQAYLVAISYGGHDPAVALAVSTMGPAHNLRGEIDAAFSRISTSTTPLDFVFLDASQQRDITQVAAPFYERGITFQAYRSATAQ
jgi:hypothetical protein